MTPHVLPRAHVRVLGYPEPEMAGVAALAGLAVMVLGALLVGLPDTGQHVVAGLVLGGATAFTGVFGGWRAGLFAATTGALSFNFFHSDHYLHLRIDSPEEVLPALAFVAVGLASALGNYYVARLERTGVLTARHALAHIIDAVADTRLETEAVVELVCDEVERLLDLEACALAPGIVGDLPVLHELSADTTGAHRILPSTDYSIAVPYTRPARTLVCVPRGSTRVSAADHLAALTVVALLGARLTASQKET